MLKQIPNFFTLLNLVCGCIAIVFILQTGETLVTVDEGAWIPQLPEKIWWGSILIGIAAIVDFLDGFVARLFKATSSMGAQLDSLADVVSFGVAPGLILYQLLRVSYIGQQDGIDTTIWALLPAFLFTSAAAWRLARFNVETNTSNNFRGMPTPAAGLFIASLPLVLFYNYFNIAALLINKWFLYGTIVLLAYFMISRIPFIAMKFADKSLRKNLPVILLVLIALIAAVFLEWLAIPVVFIFYIIFSLIQKRKTDDIYHSG